MTKKIIHDKDYFEPKRNPIPSVNRRHFLLGVATLTIGITIPGIISCSATPEYDIHEQLNPTDFKWLRSIQNHLFPSSEFGPGAQEFNAAEYFTWVLTDPNKDPRETKNMRKGLKSVQELCTEETSMPFFELTHSQKEQILRKFEESSSGKSWLSVTLTLIFEALLSDPIYGSNTREKGWKWLNHTPGIPRPTEKNKYLHV